MAEEDIQKLHSEIESLRKENQRLRIAAGEFLTQENGLAQESAVIDKDSILKVLSKQVENLNEINDQVNTMLDGYQEIQRSLGAILPALELQMEGWANEVLNLKKHIEISESAYAAVVQQLEDKLGKTKKQLRQYKGKPSKMEEGEDEDPFTDLNIFGL
ncbi:MAG: hypothetical protein MRZ79_22120 [Bacteroidia bacterium]|nr:hypothetical protein [Bacteroidia bacterium]